MKVDTLRAAIFAARERAQQATGLVPTVIYLSPQGRKLDQQGVQALASAGPLVVAAGRYEGIDERVVESDIDEEWSIGDYVLSGGELPAMVLIDDFRAGIVRTIEQAIGEGILLRAGFMPEY